jgi:amidase
VHCFAEDALGTLDAVGVAEAIRSGLVSAQEVLEAAIARVQRVEPALQAIETPAPVLAGAHVRLPRSAHVRPGPPGQVTAGGD